MGTQQGLSTTIKELSDQNYDQLFAFCRLWFDIARAHSQISPDQILGTIWYNRGLGAIQSPLGKLIHSTAPSTLRFVGDAKPDSILSPHSVSLRIRLCARFPKEFVDDSMTWHVEYRDGSWLGGDWDRFYI